MKIASQFRNGARVKRRISYADFAALSRQKAAQYSISGVPVVLTDREKDTWQVVVIDDNVPSRITEAVEE
jgi:hypothetical protein